MFKRHAVLSLVVLGVITSTAALAGPSYPIKLVRFITPASAGGSDDFHARPMAAKFTETFEQQFVVDNRPGAGGLIGQTAVINAAPDGYTIMLTGRSLTAAPYLNANVTFDPVRAFAPVTQLVTYQFALVVHPSVRANSVSEFISLARERPGKVSMQQANSASCPT